KGNAAGVLLRGRVEQKMKEWAAQYTNHFALLYAINEDAKANYQWYYTNLHGGPYWIDPEESPSVSERLDRVVNQVENVLPDLTNKISTVLNNSSRLTANL